MSRFIIDKDGCAVSTPVEAFTSEYGRNRSRRNPEPMLRINVRSSEQYLQAKVQQYAVLPLSRYTASPGSFHLYQHDSSQEVIEGITLEAAAAAADAEAEAVAASTASPVSSAEEDEEGSGESSVSLSSASSPASLSPPLESTTKTDSSTSVGKPTQDTDNDTASCFSLAGEDPYRETVPQTMHAKYASYSFSQVKTWDNFYSLVSQHLQSACEKAGGMGTPLRDIERRVTDLYDAQEDEATGGAYGVAKGTTDLCDAAASTSVYQLVYTLTRRAQIFLDLAQTKAVYSHGTGTAPSVGVQLGQPDVMLSRPTEDGDGTSTSVPVMAGIYTNDCDFAALCDDSFFLETLCSPVINEAVVCKSAAEALDTKKTKTAIDIVFRLFQYMVLNKIKYGFVSTALCTRFFMRGSTLSRTLQVSPAVSHFQGKPVNISACFVAMSMQSIWGYPRHWLAALSLRAPLGAFEALQAKETKDDKDGDENDDAYNDDDDDNDSPILGRLSLEPDDASHYSDAEECSVHLDAPPSTPVTHTTSQVEDDEDDDNVYPNVFSYPFEACPVATPAVHSLNSCHVTYPGNVKWWKVTKTRKTIHTIQFLTSHNGTGSAHHHASGSGRVTADVEVVECDMPPEAEQDFRRLERNETRRRMKGLNLGGNNNSLTFYQQQQQQQQSQHQLTLRSNASVTTFSSFASRLPSGDLAVPLSPISPIGEFNRRRRRRIAATALKVIDTSAPEHPEELAKLENEARIYEYLGSHAKESRQAVDVNFCFGSVLGFMFILGVEQNGRAMRPQDLVVEERGRDEDGRLLAWLKLNEGVVHQMHDALDVLHSLRLLHNDVANFASFIVEETEESVPNMDYYLYKKNGATSGSGTPTTPTPPPLQKSIRLRVRMANFAATKLYVRLFKAATREEHDKLDAFCKGTFEALNAEFLAKKTRVPRVEEPHQPKAAEEVKPETIIDSYSR